MERDGPGGGDELAVAEELVEAGAVPVDLEVTGAAVALEGGRLLGERGLEVGARGPGGERERDVLDARERRAGGGVGVGGDAQRARRVDRRLGGPDLARGVPRHGDGRVGGPHVERERAAGLDILRERDAGDVGRVGPGRARRGREGSVIALLVPRDRDRLDVRLAVVCRRPRERALAGEGGAGARGLDGERDIPRARHVLRREVHVVLRHGEGEHGAREVGPLRDVVLEGVEARGALRAPAPEDLRRVRARAVDRRGRAVGEAGAGLAVHRERELLGALALPGVAALVGAVGHVIAVEVDEQAVVALGVELLGDPAVALGAVAHADGRAPGERAGEVGLGHAGDALVEEQVVGVAGALAAGVALDGAEPRQLDVVQAAHEDAAAAVVVAFVAADVAGVAGDGAAGDLVVVVGHADAAALVPAGVARDGAVAHDGGPLVELDAAAVVLGAVVRDGDVLDQALVRARRPVDMDAAAALQHLAVARARVCGGVAFDAGLAVRGREGERRLVEVDAAARIRRVPVDLGAAVHRDVDVVRVTIDAAAARGCTRIWNGQVIVNEGPVHADGHTGIFDVDAAPADGPCCAIVLHRGAVIHDEGRILPERDPADQMTDREIRCRSPL